MARILVTGGAGFIGSHVVDAYLAAGHDVAVVDNLVSGDRRNLADGVPLHEVDIRAPELAEVFAAFQPEYVNHLAAQMDVRRSLEAPAFDADNNVLGTINVLECCRAHDVRKLLFASTGGAIYGEPAALPADEHTAPRPLSHYGTSKLCGEHYIRLYSRLYEIDHTILRYPNVYGPRQNPHGEAGVCAIFIGKLLAGETPVLYGHGAPVRDYVYVGDIARACLAALELGSDATLNLGSGVGTSVRELFETVARLLHWEGEPELKPLRNGEVDRITITGVHAAQVLGWHAEVSLEAGLGETIAWMRARADAEGA